MDILTIAFLAGVGVIAGIIAAIVGGAAVVIYPALIATGVPPHLAAVSNLASVMPGTMLAALSDRSQLPPFNRAFVSLVFASIIGAGIGAVCWCSLRSVSSRRSYLCFSASPRCCSLFPIGSAAGCANVRKAVDTPSRSTSPV